MRKSIQKRTQNLLVSNKVKRGMNGIPKQRGADESYEWYTCKQIEKEDRVRMKQNQNQTTYWYESGFIPNKI